jgi:hypothetical protein
MSSGESRGTAAGRSQSRWALAFAGTTDRYAPTRTANLSRLESRKWVMLFRGSVEA